MARGDPGTAPEDPGMARDDPGWVPEDPGTLHEDARMDRDSLRTGVTWGEPPAVAPGLALAQEAKVQNDDGKLLIAVALDHGGR